MKSPGLAALSIGLAFSVGTFFCLAQPDLNKIFVQAAISVAVGTITAIFFFAGFRRNGK